MTKTNARAATKSRRPGKEKKSKSTMLVDMLSRKSGADAAAISSKLGWQPHTTRAALSRLRKAGYEISSEKPGNGKPTLYRLVASPAE